MCANLQGAWFASHQNGQLSRKKLPGANPLSMWALVIFVFTEQEHMYWEHQVFSAYSTCVSSGKLLLVGCDHSWFRPVMKSLDSSMESGFQDTTLKSEVKITLNLFCPSP